MKGLLERIHLIGSIDSVNPLQPQAVGDCHNIRKFLYIIADGIVALPGLLKAVFLTLNSPIDCSMTFPKDRKNKKAKGADLSEICYFSGACNYPSHNHCKRGWNG